MLLHAWRLKTQALQQSILLKADQKSILKPPSRRYKKLGLIFLPSHPKTSREIHNIPQTCGFPPPS